MASLKIVLSGCLFVLINVFSLSAQTRKEINIPNIPGYQTLKCDFQIHSIFSDGEVWPTVRVQEAWLEGLDVIAITDPIEYHPHNQDIRGDNNRSYEIAKPLAEQTGIILIKGAEIYRQMPPGHLLLLFIKNANLLERENWWESCKEAKDQGAFLSWSNPEEQKSSSWFPEQIRLLDEGILKGVEVYKHSTFFPIAEKMANQRNLTILAGSDMKGPSGLEFSEGHRPVTLVFATGRSGSAVKDALLKQRTAIYFGDTLIGNEKFIVPVFKNSIEIINSNTKLEDQGVKQIRINNKCDIPFYLHRRQPSVGFSCPEDIILKPHLTTAVDLVGLSGELDKTPVLKLFYVVKNLLTLKGKELPVDLGIPNE